MPALYYYCKNIHDLKVLLTHEVPVTVSMPLSHTSQVC